MIKLIQWKRSFQKTGELFGLSFVKIPLRSNAILNIENIDIYSSLRSISAYLHPCENSQPSRVRNYIQLFDELNNDGFDFTNGFNCSDFHNFEKLNILFY